MFAFSRIGTIYNEIIFFSLVSTFVLFAPLHAGNLLAHWELDTTGDTAKDSSGYGNDGVVHGAVLGGGVCTFDGKDDYIEIEPYHALLNLTTDFEIEARVTLTRRPGRRIIFSKSGEDTEKSFSLETRAGQPWFAAYNTHDVMYQYQIKPKTRRKQDLRIESDVAIRASYSVCRR